MAEEVELPTVLVTVDQGRMAIRINGFTPIQLWGIARFIEKHADQLHSFEMMQSSQNDPKKRIIRPV